MADNDTSADAVKRVAATLPSAVWLKDFGPQETILALLAERNALRARVAELEKALERIFTASDHYSIEEVAHNRGALELAYAHKSTAIIARAALSQEGRE